MKIFFIILIASIIINFVQERENKNLWKSGKNLEEKERIKLI